jgi:hypothetical protein
VTVSRVAYRALGAGNLYPVDAGLNLPVGLHSHGLRRVGGAGVGAGLVRDCGGGDLA